MDIYTFVQGHESDKVARTLERYLAVKPGLVDLFPGLPVGESFGIVYGGLVGAVVSGSPVLAVESDKAVFTVIGAGYLSVVRREY